LLSIRLAVALAVLALTPHAAPAQNTLIRVPLPNGSTFPISQGVWVGNTLYLSGMLDPELGKTSVRDTKTQTIGAIQSVQKALAGQKLSLGDVVMMHVYLAPEPATGKMDFPGFMAGYSQFFGTKEQPNKPARSAMQVAALAAPTGLVEIEVIAVKH